MVLLNIKKGNVKCSRIMGNCKANNIVKCLPNIGK